jgi:chaperone required for assembly of F1-ATPase
MNDPASLDPRAVPVVQANVVELGDRAGVAVNGERLETPSNNPVEASPELAEAMVEELSEDGFADVTQPSLYAFYSTEHDFIAPDPFRTIDVLVELLGHDYLVHPDERLGRRQVQVAAWGPQIDLWQRVTDQGPPYSESGAEPELHHHDYAAFRSFLAGFSPAQLCVAMHAANILKSATLGILLAERSIDAKAALQAASVTPRFYAGDTQEDLEAQEEREELWLRAIRRLLRYAELTSGD